MYYYVSYDVFKGDRFICNRIVRFLSKRHAANCIQKWSDNTFGWTYENVHQVDSSMFMVGPNKVNHIDHSSFDLHLAYDCWSIKRF